MRLIGKDVNDKAYLAVFSFDDKLELVYDCVWGKGLLRSVYDVDDETNYRFFVSGAL